MTRGIIEGLVFVDENGVKKSRILGAVLTVADLANFTNAEEGDFAFVKSNDEGEPAVFSYNGTEWSSVGGAASGPREFYEFIDSKTGHTIKFGVRDGQLIVTDTQAEIVSTVDLGSTLADPTRLFRVSLNGSGQYTTNVGATQSNGGGIITLEYINSPGQFFVIEDINGGVFGGGDRMSFGLVRETIVDGTVLNGVEALWAGSSYGGQSFGPTMYYAGGYPYVWTSYTRTGQTPSGTGEQATGAFSGQTDQREYWQSCVELSLGVKIRVGIAQGTLTQQDGTNYTNRLMLQYYVHQEIIDSPTHKAMMPGNVQTHGAGWYTSWATNGEYEHMGQFPNGEDEGYRFKWSATANSVLNQMPYLTGVSTNDQIASASGLSYYLVYNPQAADEEAANSIISTGTTSSHNVHFASTPVKIMQFQTPHAFDGLSTVVELPYTEMLNITRSPAFVDYSAASNADIKLELRLFLDDQKVVCQAARDLVLSYYTVVDLSEVDENTVMTAFNDASNLADNGYLERTRQAVMAITATALIPQELLDDTLTILNNGLIKFVR